MYTDKYNTHHKAKAEQIYTEITKVQNNYSKWDFEYYNYVICMSAWL